MVAERQQDETGLVTNYFVKVSRYLNPYSFHGVGILGQPELHLYFHRPLCLLLQPFFDSGFALDGMEEPAFGPDAKSSAPLTWANFSDVPPALVARLRLVSSHDD